jgi:hypothetical protein
VVGVRMGALRALDGFPGHPDRPAATTPPSAPIRVRCRVMEFMPRRLRRCGLRRPRIPSWRSGRGSG